MEYKLKAVIFDMDGVLVDSEPVHIHAHERFFKDMGYTLDTSIVYERFIGSTARPLWETLKAIYDLPYEVDELIERNKAYERTQEDIEGFPPIPYEKELIFDLKAHDLMLAVASSSPHSRIVRTVKALEIEDAFDALVSGTKLPHPKPAPDTFLAAAEALGVLPGECIVIEDSHNGVQAAIAAGMPVIGFHNPHSGVQDLTGADLIVESFEEVDTALLLKYYERHFGIPHTIARTAELKLRELSAEDIPTVIDLLANESALSVSSEIPQDPAEQTDYWNSYIHNQYALYDYGLWLILDAATEEVLGVCGLHSTKICEDGELEACWLIKEVYRGRSIAQKAMDLVISYASQELDCKAILASIDDSNEASLRLAASLGMTRRSDHIFYKEISPE
ncbi:MAG: HAD-IA family hydrolase [Lachnospiraceae bacterium]|nr:HAD-IA family hydrolase [Lachnospiraceae bacterium]